MSPKLYERTFLLDFTLNLSILFPTLQTKEATQKLRNQILF